MECESFNSTFPGQCITNHIPQKRGKIKRIKKIVVSDTSRMTSVAPKIALALSVLKFCSMGVWVVGRAQQYLNDSSTVV